MKNSFVGRKKELKVLEDTFLNNEDLVLINGPRYSGKTSLVKEFIKDKNAVYFLANEVLDQQNRKTLIDILGIDPSFDLSWDELFKAISNNKDNEPRILVLDDFDHLVNNNPNFLKTFITAYRKYLKPNNIQVILLLNNNSTLSLLLEERNGLMGSVDLEIELKPMSFIQMLKLFRNYNLAELISFYSIVGGVPKYWDYLENAKTLSQQLSKASQTIFNPDHEFFSLPPSLIDKDVWEPVYYTTLLTLIAQGYKTVDELRNKTNLKNKDILRYLDNLIKLGYLKKVTSIVKRRTKSAPIYYEFDNPAYHFYFKYIFPNRSQLMAGMKSNVLKELKDSFPEYLQSQFKLIAEILLNEAIKGGNINFEISKIGPLFSDQGNIPVMVIDENNKQILLADVSFIGKEYTLEDLEEFITKTQSIKELKKFKNYNQRFAVITATEVEPELIDYAKNNNLILLSGLNIYQNEDEIEEAQI